jgi:hypothetical protein|tara:strand:+ start:57 stop:560 length:504 start_codon:yes stop_codon:yes gene_type:complete
MATRTEGDTYTPMISEIFTKVNNAKDKPAKIEVLMTYDCQPLRQVLKGAFDPTIKWDLPEGTPPYKENDAPAGTEHTTLHQEAQRLYNFVLGANDNISKTRKETLFIQVLEGLHKDEARALIAMKDKRLNLVFKGLTEQLVKEAYDWTDDFVIKPKPLTNRDVIESV